jgi:hypothetical protein
VYKYHIFLINSSLLGHLGYFHSLAVVSSAAINMDVISLYFILAKANYVK